MAKQKVVLKLSMENAKKCSKAMQCVCGMHGILSASHEEDKITVVGEGIDPVTLTRLLRKKMGHVELEVVTDKEQLTQDKQMILFDQSAHCSTTNCTLFNLNH